jgi:transcription antitermination factor NusG
MRDRDATSARVEGWFVVWTESRAEKQVAARLGARGFDAWLPSARERHRWSDRWREVVMPLFPGYLFARGNRSNVAQLLRTPGVLTLVKRAGSPVVLADDYVVALRHAVEASGSTAERVDAPVVYDVGDEVVVQDGPLAGVRGVVKESRGGRRLLIWIEEIGRGVVFTIGSAQVHAA